MYALDIPRPSLPWGLRTFSLHHVPPLCSKMSGIIALQGHWTGYSKCLNTPPAPLSIWFTFLPPSGLCSSIGLLNEACYQLCCLETTPLPQVLNSLSAFPFCSQYLLFDIQQFLLSFYLTKTQAPYYATECVPKMLKLLDSRINDKAVRGNQR